MKLSKNLLFISIFICACRVPIIMLEKSKGLSDKQLAEIQKNLEELASLKVGEVMIYELIQYVQVCYKIYYL